MSIFQALLNSFRRVRCLWKMVVLYWFIQTLAAALIALPLAGTVIPSLAHSRYSADLLRQFDFMWLMELQYATNGLPAAIVAPVALVAILLWVLASIWLAGGALRLLTAEEPHYHIGDFHEGGGLYFWRFLRLALYSLILYGIALSLGGMVTKIADKVWGKGMEEAPLVVAGWIKSGLLILLFGLIGTAMDYAKVRLVTDGSRKSLRACFGSTGLVFRNLGTTMGVWLVLALLAVLAFSIYLPVANALPATSMGPILALFVWQQLFIATRIVLRLTSWGAAAQLDPILRPRQLPPLEEELVVAVVPEAPPALEAEAQAEPPSEGEEPAL